MEKMTLSKGFDWFSDAVLLIFLSVVMGFGPDNHLVFIPAEILFVLTFGARFLVKRYKLTSMVTWSIAFLVVSFVSISYAHDKAMAFSRAKSVLQVLVFANLVMPHIRESKRSYQNFLYMYLMASLFVFIRALLSAQLDVVFASRMGVTFGINPNTVGYIFSVATIISLYLFFEKRSWLFLISFTLFPILSLFSGSRKVFILLSVGLVLLVLLYQKSMKRALIAAIVAAALLVLGIVLIMTIEPLNRIIGQRLLNMFVQLSGSNVDGSTSVRMGMVASGINMFKQKPFFGWGLGAFTDLGGFGTYAHNNYIELLVAVGLFGTLLYLALPLYIVIRGIKRFFKFQEKGPFVLSVALMVAMLFDQVARVTYLEEFSNILIALCYAGIVLDDPNKGLDVFQFFAKIFEWIRHPSMIVNHLLKWKISRVLSDKTFLSIKYRMSNGTKLNLEDPKTYNEKLQWQKIHDRNPLYPALTDKYAVRNFIADTIGKKYVVPLVGVYDNVSAIDVAALPSSFVLKPTHTSGDVLFCKDKATFDWEKANNLMNSWLSNNYYWYDREWPYKEIQPRIICEEMIKTSDGNPPRDYKIFCFDGEPKMAFVASDRSNGTKFDFFDIEWERLPLKQHYPNSTYDIPKPGKWDEMLEIARKLSVGFPQVRVDLYVDADEKILFGELTFFHFSGFEPFEPASYDQLLGSWVQLPKGN
ncbi:MAG TPA: ATP-grasp fold amidoligase family protein [Sphaerochaeta sp.]|nr:ATP-grasp fold amidoligase family protein [Sphaerochaeta sp.]